LTVAANSNTKLRHQNNARHVAKAAARTHSQSIGISVGKGKASGVGFSTASRFDSGSNWDANADSNLRLNTNTIIPTRTPAKMQKVKNPLSKSVDGSKTVGALTGGFGEDGSSTSMSSRLSATAPAQQIPRAWLGSGASLVDGDMKTSIPPSSNKPSKALGLAMTQGNANSSFLAAAKMTGFAPHTYSANVLQQSASAAAAVGRGPAKRDLAKLRNKPSTAPASDQATWPKIFSAKWPETSDPAVVFDFEY